MPSKTQLVWLGVGVLLGVIAANRLRSLPVVKSLPTF